MDIQLKQFDRDQQDHAHRAGTFQANAENGRLFALGFISGTVNGMIDAIEHGTDAKEILETVYAGLLRARAFKEGFDLAS